MDTIERDYRILEALNQNPHASQRELAEALGVSVGKVNYCLRALIEKGWIKAGNFRRSNNKVGYLYLLTPNGIEQKAKLTSKYLKIKMAEYEVLKREIEYLTSHIETE